MFLGVSSTFVQDEEMRLWAHGMNHSFQLNLQHARRQETPTEVKWLGSAIRAIGTSGSSTVILDAAGTPWTMDCKLQQYTPIQLPRPIRMIGECDFSCAMIDDLGVLHWRPELGGTTHLCLDRPVIKVPWRTFNPIFEDECGQVLTDTGEDLTPPGKSTGPLRSLATAGLKSAVVDSQGVVWVRTHEYVRVNGLPEMDHVVGGAMHWVGLDVCGKVWTWGSNNYGQLGRTRKASDHVPGQVLLNGPASRVLTGMNHSAAVMCDGSVYIWGSNFYGELGVELPQPGWFKKMTGAQRNVIAYEPILYPLKPLPQVVPSPAKSARSTISDPPIHV